MLFVQIITRSYMKKLLVLFTILFFIFVSVFLYVYNKTPYVSQYLAQYHHKKALNYNKKSYELIEKSKEQNTFHPSSLRSVDNLEYENNINEAKKFEIKADMILSESIKKYPDYLKTRIMQLDINYFALKMDLFEKNIIELISHSYKNKNIWKDTPMSDDEFLQDMQENNINLIKAGHENVVMQIAKEILKYYPNNFENLKILGEVNLSFSEFNDAQKYFNMALALSSNDEGIKQHLKHIDFLKKNNLRFHFETRGDLSFYSKKGGRIYAVKDNKILFEVFYFDNGADYLEEGLFRIVDDKGLIGFADEKGNVVIKPQYKFATSSYEGKIKATHTGKLVLVGEYKSFESDDWFIVDNPLNKKKKN